MIRPQQLPSPLGGLPAPHSSGLQLPPRAARAQSVPNDDSADKSGTVPPTTRGPQRGAPRPTAHRRLPFERGAGVGERPAAWTATGARQPMRPPSRGITVSRGSTLNSSNIWEPRVRMRHRTGGGSAGHGSAPAHAWPRLWSTLRGLAPVSPHKSAAALPDVNLPTAPGPLVPTVRLNNCWISGRAHPSRQPHRPLLWVRISCYPL